MRIFITGGTGYLGQVLVRMALHQGWQVAASYHSQQPPADDAVAWMPLDLRDEAGINAAFAVFQPELVMHTAYRLRDPDLMEVTGEGAGRVARAAQAVGARLLHMSSDALFDGERKTAYTESDPPSPITPYGEAKARAEALVNAAHPQAIIVRTSLIYGFAPLDPHTRFILAIAEGQSDERLFTDEYRCPIWVEELGAALIEVVKSDFMGLINIAGAERLSRYEFGVLLARYWGRDPQRLRQGLSIENATRRPRNCVLDSGLARSLFSTPLRGVSEVLAQRKQEDRYEPNAGSSSGADR
jgi:dTDP-4-dehydrorhamnose reductase